MENSSTIKSSVRATPARLSWDDFFMLQAELVANRSTCLRRQVGAVLVNEDQRLIASGYNGAPSGVRHCIETGCLRKNYPSGERLDLCVATHAEANAIANAARTGAQVKGAILYSTVSPCIECLKIAVNAGIAEIKYGGDYPLTSGSIFNRIVQESGIILTRIKGELYG